MEDGPDTSQLQRENQGIFKKFANTNLFTEDLPILDGDVHDNLVRPVLLHSVISADWRYHRKPPFQPNRGLSLLHLEKEVGVKNGERWKGKLIFTRKLMWNMFSMVLEKHSGSRMNWK